MPGKSKQVKSDSTIPPDGGWGWVVVAASLTANIIGDGMTYAFGVSLPKLVSHFEEGKGKIAWIGSLLSGFHLASGVIGSVLINKYGCRVTCIIGSVIGMVSFAFSSLCNSLILLMIIYGIFGGIGLGLIFLPATVCVNQYFDKKRALAMGITSCGTSIGSFVMAPLSAFLLDRYDWRGTNLIIAGIIFNCAIFGSLMRPLELSKQKLHQGEINIGCDVIDDADQFETEDNTKKEEETRLINFQLMKNPVFLLIIFSYMIAYLGFLIPYMYIIDLAISAGIEYAAASFLVSIIGISNAIGRILSGYIADFPAIEPLFIIYTCTGISGLAVLCVPFCSSYTGFSVIAAVFGLFTAPFITLGSIVLVNLVGISQLSDALGLLCLMISITAIIGSPLGGLLFDWSQSYNWTFSAAGALLLFASILFAVSHCVWSYLKRKGKQTSNKE